MLKITYLWKKNAVILQSTIALSLPQLIMLLVKALVPDALKAQVQTTLIE